jgi:type II secretory pathway component PulF
MVIWLGANGIVFGILYGTFLALGLPLHRQERARAFLQLLEMGLRQGQPPEQTVRSLSRAGTKELGRCLHEVASRLPEGTRLGDALAEVPAFLPANVRAMLKAGEEMGDIGKVLPAARQTLQQGISRTQINANNLIVLLFVSPVGPVLIWILSIWIFPKLREIARDMAPDMHFWSGAFFDWSVIMANVIVGLWLLFFVIGGIRGASTRWLGWLVPAASHIIDRLNWWLPWRRRRMQRDFSVMLSLALDAGVPEAKAVRLAAESTANSLFIARAERAIEDLRQGLKLTEAVRWLDDAGEFRWRLRNAVQPHRGFFAALAGWHEALEAKAFQQEQTASQLITTGFVCLNGAMVSLVTVGVFHILLAIMEEAAW